MSKKSRDRQQQRDEQQRAPHSEGMSRRKALGLTAALLAGGGIYYGIERETESGTPSLNDAVKVYRKLRTEIETKARIAKEEGKPFRIFMAENHSSTDALAYEMMIVDIAKRLNVAPLLWELQQDQLSALSNNINVGNTLPLQRLERERSEKLFTFANTKDCKVVPIDTKYANSDAYIADLRTRTGQKAAALLNKYLQNHSGLQLSFDVGISKDFQMQLIFGAHLPLEPDKKAAFNREMNTEYNKLMYDIYRERSVVMLPEVKNTQLYPNALVLTGRNHSQDIISSVRAVGNIVDVAFNLPDSDEGKSKDSDILPEVKAMQDWAADPNNMIQCSSTKHFDLKKLPEFIERVCEKANSKEISPGGRQ